MIKMTWDRGELDDQVEGVIVESDTDRVTVGERAVVEFNVPYRSFLGSSPPEIASGPVLRLPDRGNDVHRIPYPGVETGLPAHLLVDLE